MEPVDVFADEVVAGRPPSFELRLILPKAHRRNIVGQRVEPDVDDVRRVVGDRDAPRKFLHRPRHRDIFQCVDEVQHLAVAGGRHDKVPPFLKQPAQLRSVLREAEEIVLFLNHDRLGIMRRALAVDQVALRDERLMADAVQRLIVLLVEVAGGPDAPPNGLHASGVARLGSADEVIDG